MSVPHDTPFVYRFDSDREPHIYGPRPLDLGRISVRGAICLRVRSSGYDWQPVGRPMEEHGCVCCGLDAPKSSSSMPPTIIGKEDQRAQREITEMLRLAKNRGYKI